MNADDRIEMTTKKKYIYMNTDKKHLLMSLKMSALTFLILFIHLLSIFV